MERCRGLSLVKDVGGQVTDQEVKKWVRARLSACKELAGGVVFVDAIPRHASGKILRRLLKEIEPKGREWSRL